jgi:hypothetical protein
MEPHKMKPPDGRQDGHGAVADSGPLPHTILHLTMKLQGNCPRYHAYRCGSGSSQQSRYVNILFAVFCFA